MAVAQSLAYLRIIHEASWAIRYSQFNSNFKNKLWDQQFAKHFDNFKQIAVRFFQDIMARISQIYPDMIRCVEHEFEQTMQEFTTFLCSDSGPLTERDCEAAMAHCAHLLWLCQDFPTKWGELVLEQDNKAVGLLPGWLHSFTVLGQMIERDFEDQLKSYSARDQHFIKKGQSATVSIYQDIREYYAEQPNDALAPPVCLLLSADWASMHYFIGISPATSVSTPWSTFKRSLFEHLKALSFSAFQSDFCLMVGASFFMTSTRAIVSEMEIKGLMAFESVWLAYGKILNNIVGTFQINPETKTRAGLLLDLEDVMDYWTEVKRYIQSFPNLKPVERTVTWSELP